MEYIHNKTDFRLERETAVTFGKFDGVHLGHQKLISIVKQKAAQDDLLSAVFTFDKIPQSICPKHSQQFITTNQERRIWFEKADVDIEIEYPFTQQFMNMEPYDFIKDIIAGKLKAKYVVVGNDFTFGKDKKGNVDFLLSNSSEFGFETIVVDKERYQNIEISSSYVRDELALGHMETVNVLLGHPFSICGMVTMGNQLGRKMDIPTMNIYPPKNKMLPPNGVYASATIVDGIKYFGVTNIGTRPTISDSKLVSVETNLFDYQESVDSYGKNIEVYLVHFIRQEMKFDSIETLQKQMKSDAEFAREMFLI